MADPDSVPITPSEDSDSEPLQSPTLNSPPLTSPLPADSAWATTPEPHEADAPKDPAKKLPSLRSVSDTQTATGSLSASSTHLGVLSNARRPPAASAMSSGNLPPDLTSKMKAFAMSRQGVGMSPRGESPMSPIGAKGGSPGAPFLGGASPGFSNPVRPGPSAMAKSDSAVPKPRLGPKRGFGMKLSDMGGGPPAPKNPGDTSQPPAQNGDHNMSVMKQFAEYIDTEKGYLTFKGKAIITSKGVDFKDGSIFRISIDEIEKLDELGKGNYGTVYKVRHNKRRIPRFGAGAGLTNFKSSSVTALPAEASQEADDTVGMPMAMKEIRLELDEAKLSTILKELVILHECASPYIIEFYGAFFQENAVYMCIEYMDGGSIDKLYEGGVPENVLKKIAFCTILGLKDLKDKHNIIHRDVKPTNILVNTRGQVKICDFGVSGNLVASIAKTNIGCQSYMAPERISGGSLMQGASDGTYSVQSDIWSLGLTMIECAMGKYPYPPEVSSTIFSQLSVSRFAPFHKVRN